MSDLLFENSADWPEDEHVAPSPPARIPTQPDIRLDPATVPEFRAYPRVTTTRCYFCGDPAADIVNFDIPTCGKHGRRE